jgi:RNA polymerase sigma-70 factor (ECF subfamily)
MTPAQFSKLYLAVLPMLKGRARNLAKNADDADDLLQTTALKAWAAREQFKEGTNFGAWLATIMRHEFLDIRRTAKPTDTIDDVPESVFAFPALQHRTMEAKQALSYFGGLTAPHRKILRLASDQLSYDEMAAELDVPPGTVRSRLSRARQTFSERIGA